MKYIYTAKLDFKELDVRAVIEVIGAANLYGFEKVLTRLAQYVGQTFSIEDFCQIYSKTHSLKINDLDEAFCQSMEAQPDTLLQSEAFLQLPAYALCRMLSRDTFRADEIDIFKAVHRWCKKQPNDEGVPEVLKTIRLPLISTLELASSVRTSGLIPVDRLLEVIGLKQSGAANLKHRLQIVYNENLATPERGAQELTISDQGDIVSQATSPAYNRWPLSRQPTVCNPSGLIVELDKPHRINHIELEIAQLPNVYKRRLSGSVEFSLNLKEWTMLGHYGDHVYSTKLHFKPRAIRYIRIKLTKTELTLSRLSVCYLKSLTEPSAQFDPHGELEFLNEEESIDYSSDDTAQSADASLSSS